MKKFLSTTKVNSRRSSETKRVYPLVAVVLTGLLLFYLVPQVLFFVASGIMFPIHATADWVRTSSASFPSYLRDRAALEEEVRSLEQEIAEVSGLSAELDYLENENSRLTTLLGNEEEDRIVAGITARPNQLPYDTLLLDKGKQDGVVVHAPVYSGAHTVVGYVQSVREHSSLVTLVSTPGFTSTVFVFGPDIYTNAEGMGGGLLRVGVPQGIELSVGDSVVLPAVSRGLYGTISYIETSPTQPEQFGYVVAHEALRSLHYVAVGRSALQSQSFDAANENVEAAYLEYFTVDVPESELVTIGATSTASTTEMASTTTSSTTPLEE